MTTLVSGGAMPVGAIIAFGGDKTNLPAGFLLCDGSTINRNEFSDLFAAIGTSWGNGDGATTFELPDARGRFLRNQDDGAGNDSLAGSRTTTATGGNTGDNVGSYQDDGNKSHNHGLRISTTSNGNTEMVNGVGFGQRATNNENMARSAQINSQNNAMITTVGDEARPKNVYVYYIIKF